MTKDKLDKVLNRVAKRTKNYRRGRMVMPTVQDDNKPANIDPVRRAMLEATKPTQEK